ncbi:hypothetical protein BJ138DRAFT_1226874 [Hygrophoropsis aurantiaca]|uniref:Uncharacterized protein n=1 Tax=Hygrophoropsis aurantiaca TaxID=72124 RepID=A0ACB7ZYS4_9AGAM|nr:hypothetical protein BJ138DRAFT_1226874 [Hygrophoropsis aurantiaca]
MDLKAFAHDLNNDMGQPQSDVEVERMSIFSEVLKVENGSFGVLHDLFAAGLDSLMAVQAAGIVSEAFSVYTGLNNVYLRPTIFLTQCATLLPPTQDNGGLQMGQLQIRTGDADLTITLLPIDVSTSTQLETAPLDLGAESRAELDAAVLYLDDLDTVDGRAPAELNLHDLTMILKSIVVTSSHLHPKFRKFSAARQLLEECPDLQQTIREAFGAQSFENARNITMLWSSKANALEPRQNALDDGMVLGSMSRLSNPTVVQRWMVLLSTWKPTTGNLATAITTANFALLFRALAQENHD